jgi:Mn-dependent DtxR family transcriptional regulator
MTKEKIGQTAGQIWEILNTKGEVSLSQLPRLLKITSDLTYQALGWLAREDKVEYRTKVGKVYVSLAEKERVVSQVRH